MFLFSKGCGRSCRPTFTGEENHNGEQRKYARSGKFEELVFDFRLLTLNFKVWRLSCQVSDGSGEVGAARITSEVLEVMVKVGKIFQYLNIWWWYSCWAKYFHIWWWRWFSRWTKYIFPFKVPDMVNRMTGVDVTNVRTIPEKYLWISLKFKSLSTLNICPCSKTQLNSTNCIDAMWCQKTHITFYL